MRAPPLNNINSTLLLDQQTQRNRWPYIDALRQTPCIGHKRTFVSDKLPQQVTALPGSFLLEI